MMDCYSAVNPASKPPIGRRMKSRAPPPPSAPEPAPRRIFRNAVPDGGGGGGGAEVKENLVRSSVDIQLTLPNGEQTATTVDGSKALMDLLVALCGQHHLNPSHHTLELLSARGESLVFKPNAPLGSQDVACVLIKEKVAEDRVVRRPAPKVPEKTIRLVVNYHRSQKTVLRVNPLVPLHNLVPVICDKCEFDPARVLLLRDSFSHHELPLDRTLTELGLREIYVEDQSLDSLRSSSLSVGVSEKKGLLGIFRFNRKSKSEQSSQDMEDSDDYVECYGADPTAYGLSSSTVACVEDRPSTLGQSQSVMNISRMSPKAEPKKRRAPGPPQAPPTPGDYSLEAYQATPGSPRSDSQLRKRKAPGPPPTPTSDTPLPPPTPRSVTPDPEPPATAPSPPAPAPVSPPAPATATPPGTAPATPPGTATPPAPAPVSPPAPAPPPGTATPPAPATRSMAPQGWVRGGSPAPPPSSSESSPPPLDSCSELSHSVEDSDSDPDPAESLCSTSSYYSNGSVSASSTALAAAAAATSSAPSSRGDQSETAASSAVSEETLNLKMEEVENNRHSAIGVECHVPPKPRRTPPGELSQPILPPPHPSPSPPLAGSVPSQRSPGEEEEEGGGQVEKDRHQSWLHSQQTPPPDTQLAQEETLSLGSSGSGSGLQDQGYAASEGMVEADPDGEDPGQGRPGAGPQGGLTREGSSSSDEGCATWGSGDRPVRHDAATRNTGPLSDGYGEDLDLTAQLDRTLAGLEADLAVESHTESSGRDLSRVLSSDSNDVPVSFLELDVPVTTIDEVLEEYDSDPAPVAADYRAAVSSTQQQQQQRQPEIQPKQQPGKQIEQHQPETLPLQQQAQVKGQPATSGELGNRNNNACTSAGETGGAASPRQQRRKPAKTAAIPVTTKAKEPEPGPAAPPHRSAAGGSAQEEEVTRPYRAHAPPSSSSAATQASKITHNPVSRFGMRTFTVVPPKPAVVQPPLAAATKPAASPGAIRIDEQGNMVRAGVAHSQGGVAHSKGGVAPGAGAAGEADFPLPGKAKAFWSSTEKHDGGARGQSAKVGENPKTAGRPPAFETGGKPGEAKSGNGDVVCLKLPKEQASGMKPSPPETTQPPSVKGPPPPPSPSNGKRDLSFLKPSRRTSSQYVASAISRYASKPATPSDVFPHVPGSSSSSSSRGGFQRGARSPQVVDPPPATATPTPASPPGKQTGAEEGVRWVSGTLHSPAGGAKKPDTARSTGHASPTRRGPTLVHNGVEKPQPAAPLLSSAATGETGAPVPPATAEKPQLPHGVRGDGVRGDGVPARQHLASVFGPVKTFRPVELKSAPTDSNPHSSLMEAIQTAGGKDSLKKVPASSRGSAVKRTTSLEEDNERSALLAAIRAPSTAPRLRQTKSEAAGELERIRKSSDENGRSPSPPPPPSLLSSPAFTPPPPPPSTLPPPPPPPTVQPKPSAGHGSGAVVADAALAREAMMEAIRSGSAAEKLKKVSAPTKTVKVNGRLGTIRASSSSVSP